MGFREFVCEFDWLDALGTVSGKQIWVLVDIYLFYDLDRYFVSLKSVCSVKFQYSRSDSRFFVAVLVSWQLQAFEEVFLSWEVEYQTPLF